MKLWSGRLEAASHPALEAINKSIGFDLRLWPWEGKDLLHGLVRIEVARSDEAVGRASEISGWILAERVPLSRPDQRWDRLLYGIAGVERHLRSTG